jgi:hypothetical protein
MGSTFTPNFYTNSTFTNTTVNSAVSARVIVLNGITTNTYSSPVTATGEFLGLNINGVQRFIKVWLGGEPDNNPFAGFTGWDEGTYAYYIDGVETTLDQDGNGDWNNYYYLGGYPQNLYTGWDGASYYYEGFLTSLGQNGTGWDTYNVTYFINGIPTTLDQNGNGAYNNYKYVNGSPTHVYQGWDSNTNIYYINGNSTTLPQNGTGCWSGNSWIGGVFSHYGC